jgi:ssDNA-binding Zn-finger/Zn-ribbon topoisomerase 1
MNTVPQVAGYAALCPTCGGGWGLASTKMPATHLAASLAGWAADGAAIVSDADVDVLKAMMAVRCECPPAGPFHTETVGCPECGYEPWDAPKKRTTCRECGARYTTEKVFTLYAQTTRPARKTARVEV